MIDSFATIQGHREYQEDRYFTVSLPGGTLLLCGLSCGRVAGAQAGVQGAERGGGGTDSAKDL